MNTELRDCLRTLGFDGADAPNLWQRLVVVVNYGRVPHPSDDYDRGFKLLLLDKQGRTEWFGRCGWANREAMEREIELNEALLADPVASRHVPFSRSAHTEHLFLQLSRYLGECAYGGMLAARTPTEWMRDVREIVALSDRLMQVARARVPRLAHAPSEEVRRQWLDADLKTLAAAGLPGEMLARFGRLIGPTLNLRPELQHGDLWPANVLRSENRWWLIDYAETGVVWSPLYDLLHMLSNAPPGAAREWYASGSARISDPWVRTRLLLLREASLRRGMGAVETGASLLHYLVHLTAYRLRPGVEFELSADLRRELVRVGDFLYGCGDDPAQLCTPYTS